MMVGEGSAKGGGQRVIFGSFPAAMLGEVVVDVLATVASYCIKNLN
jgi:hypothetical protein